MAGAGFYIDIRVRRSNLPERGCKHGFVSAIDCHLPLAIAAAPEDFIEQRLKRAFDYGFQFGGHARQ